MRNRKGKLALLCLAGMVALGLVALVWAIGAGSSEAQQGTMRNCPQAGKWAIAVWDGDDGTDAAQALATCGEGAVAVAYSIDPETQAWSRWFAGRPDISNLTALDNMQGVIAFGAPSASPAAMLAPPSGEGTVQGCPQAGKWAISVWNGQNAVGADPALETCGPGAVSAAYYLDPETGGWLRWLGRRPAISTLETLNNLQGFIALGPASFTLAVDKFGEGTITSSPGSIDCGSDCTYQSATFPVGTGVVLTGTADPDSTLSHWTGCDSVSDNACTVAVDADKTVFPTFAFTEVKIPETTKVLDETTMGYLIRQEGPTYYFAPQAEAVANLEVGDVIVSGIGEGFLRKVTAVNITAQEIAVETTGATLENAIEQGTIIVHETLTPADLQAAQTDGSETSVCEGALLQWPLEAEFVVAKVEGQTCFDVDLDIAVSFAGWDWDCWCYPVKEARAIATVGHNMYLKASAGVELEETWEKEIAQYDFSPIWVSFGPLPVGFFPELAINVGVEGFADATIKSELKLTNELKVGVHYRQDSGWGTVSEYKRSFEWEEPECSEDNGAGVTAYVEPQLSVKVYGLVGPKFGVKGFLELVVQPEETHWWSLYGGISASAGLDVEALGLSLEDDGSVDLAELKWLLARAAGPADSDNDGIPDRSDNCPNKAEDYDNFEDSDGCPDTDNDNDGIDDGSDNCPNEAEDDDDIQDEDGCPETDADNDGILDESDECPLEAENYNGYQDDDGCSDEAPEPGPTTGYVAGQVFYADGSPYDGGNGDYGLAYLCPSGKDPTSTDCENEYVGVTSLGWFAFEDVTPGDYTIFITCGEHAPCRDPWAEEDIEVGASESVSVTIYLYFGPSDIHFTGKVMNQWTMPACYNFWSVAVAEVLAGPELALATWVDVNVSYDPCYTYCWGEIDHSVIPGDYVEVFGWYGQVGDVGPYADACRETEYTPRLTYFVRKT